MRSKKLVKHYLRRDDTRLAVDGVILDSHRRNKERGCCNWAQKLTLSESVCMKTGVFHCIVYVPCKEQGRHTMHLLYALPRVRGSGGWTTVGREWFISQHPGNNEVSPLLKMRHVNKYYVTHINQHCYSYANLLVLSQTSERTSSEV
jgi:hypothetical protein